MPAFTPDLLSAAGLIFGLRVVEMALDTVRMLILMRGRRGIAWVIGFGQSILFVFAITTVLSNLDSFLTMTGYAAGFATGNVLGMWIEEKLAIGHAHLRIISSRNGPAVAKSLRHQGFAVTEVSGRGKDGMVTLINCSAMRRQTGEIARIVRTLDPNAFVTVEDIRPVRRGFWRA